METHHGPFVSQPPHSPVTDATRAGLPGFHSCPPPHRAQARLGLPVQIAGRGPTRLSTPPQPRQEAWRGVGAQGTHA